MVNQTCDDRRWVATLPKSMPKITVNATQPIIPRRFAQEGIWPGCYQRILSLERLGDTHGRKKSKTTRTTSHGCLVYKTNNLTDHQALIVLVLVSAPPALMVLVSAPPPLMATFTASSIGSLKGTSIRSRPCS
jgi:hypothetical protein